MQGMNSQHVDLIYLDPPFNTEKFWMAPVGSKAAGLAFKDMWTWDDVDAEYLEGLIIDYPSLARYISTIQDNHSKAMMAYSTYMAIRLIEMKRVLKDTGLIYLHCDSTASHYLKNIMDGIFKRNNFVNEIIWQRNDGRAKGSQFGSKKWGANTDTILVYSKSNNYVLNPIRKLNQSELNDSTFLNSIGFKFDDNDGKGRYKKGIPIYRSKEMDPRPNLCFIWRGLENKSPAGWRLSKERLEEEYQKGNIILKKNNLGRVVRIERRLYLKDYAGITIDNFWDDIARVGEGESTGYRTQKPLKLMHRIIESSSKEGDLVFDPFCGTATSCVASENLRRKWVGVDLSEKSADLVVNRLSDEYTGGLFGNFIHLKSPPKRNDIEFIDPNSESVKNKLYVAQKKICNGCEVEFLERNLTVDHKLPRSKGGQDFIDNLQLLCGACNSVKGDRPMSYLLEKNKKVKELLEYKISFK